MRNSGFCFTNLSLLVVLLLVAACEAKDTDAKVETAAGNDAIAAATARLKKIIIDNAAAANKPNVYVDVFGKVTRVQVVSADDKGVTVVTAGNNLQIEWKRISAEHLGGMAQELSKTGNELVEVVRFSALNQLPDRADKASIAALTLDKNLGPDVKAALALLPAKPAASATVSTAVIPSKVQPSASVGPVIPESRRIDWKPGVPGGIPKYGVFASVKDAPYAAKADGKADDTQAIQKAINDCPVGKAVLLPAGTYRLTAMLEIRKGIVLRGEGPEKTRLINEASAGHTIGMGFRDSDVPAKILGGCTKGSTVIAVAEPAKFKAGDLILVDQLNDPDLVDINGCGGACTWAGRDGGKRAMGQLVRVLGKDGANLSLSRPLYFSFKEALQPEADRIDRPVINAGVEDLYMTMTATNRSDSTSPIKIEHGIHCWVKNVESYKGWFAGHVSLQSCLGCEVRDCYFHHCNTFGGGYGYGVWVFAESTDTLVENNIFNYLHCGMMIESGGCGNVFGYNYSSRMFGRDYPNTDWAHSDISLHGAHPYMNLFEGNYVSSIGFDFYWGSASHNTIFRNFADMDCQMVNGQSMMAIMAVRLDQRNYFINVLGNVFGHEGTKGIVEAPTPNFGQKMVWHLGYKTPSSGGPAEDPKTAQTLLRHGNLDFISKQIQWDPAISARQLPKSLYLTAKPAFFGNQPWPAMGPDASPVYSSIPARDRFLKMPKSEQ